MGTMTWVGQATGGEPAGGAAIGEALGATAAAGVATALIAVLTGSPARHAAPSA